jgi:hypothetical protein
VQVSPCGLARDPKSLGSLFLLQPFKINKPDQFNLLRFEGDALFFVTEATAWFIAPRFPGSFDGTPDTRPSPPGAREQFCFFSVRHP